MTNLNRVKLSQGKMNRFHHDFRPTSCTALGGMCWAEIGDYTMCPDFYRYTIVEVKK